MRLLDDAILARAREVAALRGVARAAVIDGERTIDWRELAEASRRAALGLTAAGVRRGERVVVVAANAIESVVACLAVLRAGGVLVPVSAETRLARLRAIVANIEPHTIVAPRTVLAALRAAAAEDGDPRDTTWVGFPLDDRFGRPIGVPAEFGRPAAPSAVNAREAGAIDADLAAILSTSGTTGEPKGVMLTHANLMNTTAAIAEYLGHDGASAPDVVSCAIPIAYSYGLLQTLAALRTGSTLVLERSFAFPYDAMRRLERHRATVLLAVPSMIARIVATLPQVEVDLSALRAITNAAAALPPAHALRLLDLLPHVELHLMYGQTECSRATTLDPRLARTHPDSVGRAIPNSETFLVDGDGHMLPPGREGELVVRGANVARGYWRNPRETASRFVPSLSEHATPFERVLRTGDRFRMDRNGLLFFVGRSDEIFKCRGEKVAPLAVERALCAIGGVVEAAVAGVPHEEDGTAIKAIVVLASDATVDERAIRAHCRETLEPALQPRFIEFRREIPRTENGKLARGALVGAGS